MLKALFEEEFSEFEHLALYGGADLRMTPNDPTLQIL